MSPYPSEEAKVNRNEIANNMMKYYRQQFEKGEHQIGGKQYNVKKDLYDVVPKNKEWHISINSKGATYVHYQRYFLQGSTYPTVKVEEKHRGFFKWLFK